MADIYQAHNRNTPMACFSSSLFGTGLGPFVCGFIAQYTTWRWIFYMQIIIGGLISAAVLLFFRETRAPVILRKKAKLLNKWYEDLEAAGINAHEMPSGEGVKRSEKPLVALRIRWKVAADDERANLMTMLRTSLLRPFMLLFTEPVVFFFSLWAAFSWSVLYINLSAIPLIFETTYGFSLSEADGVFTVSCIGTLLATFLSIWQENVARDGSGGIQSRSIDYTFCRNMLGGIFPLISRQLFSNLAFGPAGSLLGAIGAALTLVPWVLVFYGRTIRANSKLTRNLMG